MSGASGVEKVISIPVIPPFAWASTPWNADSAEGARITAITAHLLEFLCGDLHVWPFRR